MSSKEKTVRALKDHEALGEKLFGPDRMQWKFVCPACGHVASVQEYKDAGAPQGSVGFSCIGRFTQNPREAFEEGDGPCNYAGGGLLRIAPVQLEGDDHYYFDFASAGEHKCPDCMSELIQQDDGSTVSDNQDMQTWLECPNCPWTSVKI